LKDKLYIFYEILVKTKGLILWNFIYTDNKIIIFVKNLNKSKWKFITTHSL
jgi:hypothetical protein